jgi:alkylhydroperoxidase/carboxymuconolactone decarboxylase family protein YurZ
MSKRDKEFELANEYCKKYYGLPISERDHMARLYKYAPDIMTSWLLFRKSTWKSIKEGGHLSTKDKELVAIGIETATMKEHVGHVERALDEGATVEEIAEVIGISIMLAGFESYMIGGRHALKRAEEYAEKLKKDKSRSVW